MRWGDTTAGRSALEALRSDRRNATVRWSRGRITVRLTDEAVAELGARLEAGDGAALRPRSSVAGERWVVEFCDPNATKALHVGHLRNVALGNALASALELAGAAVVRQSIVCDIGRNVCEAMAGYIGFRDADDPGITRTKPDRFVGECYARYVGSLDAAHEADGPDAPIARELRVRDDLAERLMRRWMENDDEVRALWRRVRAWALAGQQETLTRLGIRLDRILYESDAFSALSRLVAVGRESALLRSGDGGALVYDTARPEYPTLPLVRADGFPTEHLRVLALWLEEPVEAHADACAHVLGDEWLTSTGCRWDLLSQLPGGPPYDRYLRVPHGMVTIGGDKLKSSAGHDLLVDDVLDRLTGSEAIRDLASDGVEAENVARIVALGFFLDGRPATRPIEFSWGSLERRAASPGWDWAEAWTAAQRGAASAHALDLRQPEQQPPAFFAVRNAVRPPSVDQVVDPLALAAQVCRDLRDANPMLQRRWLRTLRTLCQPRDDRVDHRRREGNVQRHGCPWIGVHRARKAR